MAELQGPEDSMFSDISTTGQIDSVPQNTIQEQINSSIPQNVVTGQINSDPRNVITGQITSIPQSVIRSPTLRVASKEDSLSETVSSTSELSNGGEQSSSSSQNERNQPVVTVDNRIHNAIDLFFGDLFSAAAKARAPACKLLPEIENLRTETVEVWSHEISMLVDFYSKNCQDLITRAMTFLIRDISNTRHHPGQVTTVYSRHVRDFAESSLQGTGMKEKFVLFCACVTEMFLHCAGYALFSRHSAIRFTADVSRSYMGWQNIRDLLQYKSWVIIYGSAVISTNACE